MAKKRTQVDLTAEQDEAIAAYLGRLTAKPPRVAILRAAIAKGLPLVLGGSVLGLDIAPTVRA